LNDDNNIKNEFNPLYLMILDHWFPPTEGYDICPQWSAPGSTGMGDVTIALVIEHH
jgi:hypothetical protein